MISTAAAALQMTVQVADVPLVPGARERDTAERVGRYARRVTFERITVDPDVMGGVPTIRGLRIPVATVVAMVADGMTAAEIVDDLPDLMLADVSESLRYAAEAVRERELPLRHSAAHEAAAR